MISPEKIRLAAHREQATGSPNFAWHDSNELRSYSGIPAEGDVPDEKALELIHGYHACVACIDAQIQLILDQLDTLGLRENTLIVLWGDHGFHLGDNGIWCKHTNYEVSTRVPLIVAGPGVKGQRTQMPVGLVDLYPSLCDLAGIPQPEGLEGTSFAAKMADPSLTTQAFTFTQFPRGKRMGYAIRSERFRYVLWYDSGTDAAKPSDTIAARELYDYEKDPLERRNWSKDSNYQSVIEPMHSALTQWIFQ